MFAFQTFSFHFATQRKARNGKRGQMDGSGSGLSKKAKEKSKENFTR